MLEAIKQLVRAVEVYKVSTSPGTALTVDGPRIVTMGKLGLPSTVNVLVELLSCPRKFLTDSVKVYRSVGTRTLGIEMILLVVWPNSFNLDRRDVVSAPVAAETVHSKDSQPRPPEPLVRVGLMVTSSQPDTTAGTCSTTTGETGFVGAFTVIVTASAFASNAQFVSARHTDDTNSALFSIVPPTLTKLAPATVDVNVTRTVLEDTHEHVVY